MRQIEEISVDEYIDKFLKSLQYVGGEAYDTNQKKVRGIKT